MPEFELKKAMRPDVRLVLAQKRVLLWEKMLRDNDYPDMGVVEELKAGSDLVGAADITVLWPKKFSPAVMTVDDLKQTATRERNSLMSSFLQTGDLEIDEEVWGQTLAEAKSGSLDGPIDLSKVPIHCPLSRRFGIRQGEKVSIDDFSRSSVNASVQTEESPRPQTLDVVACVALRAMSIASGSEPWLGRTFDLKCAYRQCAVHPAPADFSHIVVQEPVTRRVWAFRMRALPFGSIRSVHSFLRVAHSRWFLGVVELKIPRCNYFDDFVTLSTSSEAKPIAQTVDVFFKLLGWRHAEDSRKAPPFQAIFGALGVSGNVTVLHRGSVLFDNTGSRKRELLTMINEILELDTLPRAHALRVRGRLQFASGQLFGRIAKGALQAITAHAYCSNS